MIKYIMIALAAVGISTAAQAQVTTERLNEIMLNDALPFLQEHELTSFISNADDDELPSIVCGTINQEEVFTDGRTEGLVTAAVWSWVDWEITVVCNVDDDPLLAQTVVHEMVHWVQAWNVLQRKPSRHDRERLGGIWYEWYPCMSAMEAMAYTMQFFYYQSDDLNEDVVENLTKMIECDTDALQPYND